MEGNTVFERYTKPAVRVIFFARFGASECGSESIEPEHVLLGLARHDPALLRCFLALGADRESLDKEMAARAPRKPSIPTNVELPLNGQCKRVLDFATEEADRLGSKHIGTEHLLLGLLREEGCIAAQLLKPRGAELTKIRNALAANPWPATIAN